MFLKNVFSWHLCQGEHQWLKFVFCFSVACMLFLLNCGIYLCFCLLIDQRVVVSDVVQFVVRSLMPKIFWRCLYVMCLSYNVLVSETICFRWNAKHKLSCCCAIQKGTLPLVSVLVSIFTWVRLETTTQILQMFFCDNAYVFVIFSLLPIWSNPRKKLLNERISKL